jgi:hypothetical protein
MILDGATDEEALAQLNSNALVPKSKMTDRHAAFNS